MVVMMMLTAGPQPQEMVQVGTLFESLPSRRIMRPEERAMGTRY